MIYMIILSIPLLAGLYVGREIIRFVDREDAAQDLRRK